MDQCATNQSRDRKGAVEFLSPPHSRSSFFRVVSQNGISSTPGGGDFSSLGGPFRRSESLSRSSTKSPPLRSSSPSESWIQPPRSSWYVGSVGKMSKPNPRPPQPGVGQHQKPRSFPSSHSSTRHS